MATNDRALSVEYDNTTSGLTAATAQGAIDELLGRIASLEAGGIVQPGDILIEPTGTVKPGYLECNGAAVNRTTYADLFAAIGTIYGVGDGSTTFNIPDMRGEFLRGWDNARGVDSGRTIGSAQAEEVGSHVHDLPKSFSGNCGDTGNFQGEAANSGTTATNVNSGSENRPRNIAMMFAIKY